MSWDDLQNAWQGHDNAAPNPEQTGAIIASAKERSEKLHRQVRRRDRLETLVALLLIPIFLVAGIIEARDGMWIMVAGCAVVVAACIYIPLKLRKARKLLPEARAEDRLVDYLRDEHRALNAQAELLRGILGWYLAPIVVGVLLISLGSGPPGMGDLIYAGFVLVVSGLIYYANIYAAKHHVAPQIDAIEAELETLSG